MSPARAALTFAVALTGCPHPASVTGPDTVAIVNADVQLRGAWRLQRFQPERPLDAMGKALVELQYGNLRVRCDQGRFVAEAPCVHVDRAYRIVEAEAGRFKVVSYDEQGVPYDPVCTFVKPDALEINAWTPPWRGVATLTRVPP